MEANGDLVLFRQPEEGECRSLHVLSPDLDIDGALRSTRNRIQGDPGLSPVLSPLPSVEVPSPAARLPSEPLHEESEEAGLVPEFQLPDLRPEVAEDGLDQVTGVQEAPEAGVEIDDANLKESAEEVTQELLVEARSGAELAVNRHEDGVFRARASLEVCLEVVPAVPLNPGHTERPEGGLGELEGGRFRGGQIAR